MPKHTSIAGPTASGSATAPVKHTVTWGLDTDGNQRNSTDASIMLGFVGGTFSDDEGDFMTDDAKIVDEELQALYKRLEDRGIEMVQLDPRW